MATTRLTGEQADGVMRKMCGFIEQEALEKAKEIKLKADQDYHVEKARIVRRDVAIIQEQFKKREKEAETRRKIFITRCHNEAKIAVLRKQDETLSMLAESVREKLGLIVKDEQKYKTLLEGLVVQGVFSLLEPDIGLNCLERDVSVVESVLPAAKKRIHEQTGISCNFTLDKNNFLPESEIGGVVVTCLGSRIKVLNSLASRLETARRQMLPEIRILLYGPPLNRRFCD